MPPPMTIPLHGRDDGHLAGAHGAKREEIAAIELDDALRVRLHLLDVDAAAESLALGSDQHHAHLGLATER